MLFIFVFIFSQRLAVCANYKKKNSMEKRNSGLQ